jgi:hypothetical protein
MFVDRIEARIEGASLTARGEIKMPGLYVLMAVLGAAGLSCLALSAATFLGVLTDDAHTPPPRGFVLITLAIGAFLLMKMPSIYRRLSVAGRDEFEALVTNAAAMA